MELRRWGSFAQATHPREGKAECNEDPKGTTLHIVRCASSERVRSTGKTALGTSHRIRLWQLNYLFIL